jgi:hypothetical protein
MFVRFMESIYNLFSRAGWVGTNCGLNAHELNTIGIIPKIGDCV